jgi:hypothetical protein
MTPVVFQDENVVIGAQHYLPAVSIVLPFEPMMSLKSELEYKLKRALEKIETELMANYPVEKAMPVLLKLQHLIYNLNYNTHKKSIAIFVSPLVEKVYYLDIPVEEKIMVDESFEIRDLVYSKKQNIQYLVLVLSAEKSKMFLGNCSKFMLIKSNVPDNIFAYKNDIAERVANFSDPTKRKEILLDKFLRHMDDDLSIILKAYNFPVFVMGPEKVLGHFKKISRSSEKLVEFIHGNYNDSTEPEIRKALDPYIKDWKKVKQQNLMQELTRAIDDEKVALGIHGVWQAAQNKNAKLLIVEKDFMYSAEHGAEPDKIYKLNSITHNPFYIKDAVDDVMEKVLQNGGDVEFVDNGLLHDYGRIALLKFY